MTEEYDNLIDDNSIYKKPKQLTDREMEVLKYLVQGMTNTQIGKILNLSPHTVKSHVCAIFQKLTVRDRVQAAVKAVREKIVD